MSKTFSIEWTPEAHLTYIDVITYLVENWSVSVAEEFENKTLKLLAGLKSKNKYLLNSI